MADPTPSNPAQPGDSGGAIGALQAFQYQMGLAVEAVVSAANVIEAKAAEVKKSVKELDEAAARVDSTSTLARDGADPTNSVGSSTTAVLNEATAGLQQQAGRR